MAIKHHLAVLKRGVATWNKWRDDNPNTSPDLSRENLLGIDLTAANLENADLQETVLWRANLSEANLRYTNLSGANLEYALLGHADLRGSNLNEASLHGADMAFANLTEANLCNMSLSRALLIHAKLVGANLNPVDLSCAVLASADLQNATLLGNFAFTNFSRADLRNAQLNGAGLLGVTLCEADLSGASLVGAALNSSDLSGAKLNGTDLTNASIGSTVFGNTDLRSVKGLTTITHHAPSTIGFDTISKSNGNIPEDFLRKAGVPEDFIIYVRSLSGKSLASHSCFISFTESDDRFAERLYNDLQAAGVRCWRWKENAEWGKTLMRSIDEAVHEYDKLVVICSKASLNSPAVIREMERALQKEDALIHQGRQGEVLFPLRLDDYVFQGWQHHRKADVIAKTVGDFHRWQEPAAYANALHRLIRDLQPKS